MNDGKVRVVLKGRLAQLFGAEWRLHVSSPAEAIRAIDANTEGRFRRYLLGDGGHKHYQVALSKPENALDEQGIRGPCGAQDIYLLPVIGGASSGLGKILTGIALIALTVTTFGAGGVFAGGLFGVSASTWATAGIGLGASLVLGGAAQLLTPVPKFDSLGGAGSDENLKASNVFQGNAQTVSQGMAVPVVYGRALVAPMPISISFTAVDQGSTNVASFATQDYTVTTNPAGGFVEYEPDPVNSNDNLPDFGY